MRKAAGTKRKTASKPRLAAAGKRHAARAAPSTNKPAAAAMACIELPAACTLRDAAALKALLVGSVCTGNIVAVAGGAVTRIDAAGLQLLAAFALREQSAGRQLQWQSASAALHAASAQLGLSAVLQLSQAGGAA